MATISATALEGLLDGLVADAATAALPTLTTDVLLDTAPRRRSVAEQTLAFVASLPQSPKA